MNMQVIETKWLLQRKTRRGEWVNATAFATKEKANAEMEHLRKMKVKSPREYRVIEQPN